MCSGAELSSEAFSKPSAASQASEGRISFTMLRHQYRMPSSVREVVHTYTHTHTHTHIHTHTHTLTHTLTHSHTHSHICTHMPINIRIFLLFQLLLSLFITTHTGMIEISIRRSCPPSSTPRATRWHLAALTRSWQVRALLSLPTYVRARYTHTHTYIF
jgi:hypothetical protein